MLVFLLMVLLKTKQFLEYECLDSKSEVIAWLNEKIRATICFCAFCTALAKVNAKTLAHTQLGLQN